MSMTLTARFETRREAEMAFERLVQEQGVERSDIFISAEGDANTAGEEPAGADSQAGQPSPEGRDDAALNGRILVSVDIQDDDRAALVRAAFKEFDARDVAQD